MVSPAFLPSLFGFIFLRALCGEQVCAKIRKRAGPRGARDAAPLPDVSVPRDRTRRWGRGQLLRECSKSPCRAFSALTGKTLTGNGRRMTTHGKKRRESISSALRVMIRRLRLGCQARNGEIRGKRRKDCLFRPRAGHSRKRRSRCPSPRA